MTQQRRNRSHGRWGGMWAKAGTTAMPARRIGREMEREFACVLWTCRRLRAGSVGLEARKAGRVPVACNDDASDGAATMSHWQAGATQAGSVSVCGATCGKNATWVGDSAAAIAFQSIREQNSRAGTSICVCVCVCVCDAGRAEGAGHRSHYGKREHLFFCSGWEEGLGVHAMTASKIGRAHV